MKSTHVEKLSLKLLGFVGIRRLARGFLACAVLAMALVAASTGCTRHIKPPEYLISDPAELRVAIDTRLSVIETARFRDTVLEYFGKGERIRVRQLILVRQPDMLRIQTRLPGSDEILSLLVSDGDSFALHQRDTHEYFTGAPTRENINRLLPVDLSGADVVRVLLGGAPWDRFEREEGVATVSWDSRTGRYIYRVQTEGGGSLVMQVRPTDFAVVSVTETNSKGDRVYEYSTSRWQNIGQVALATYSRFVWPEQNIDFSLDMREIQLDVELDESLFTFPAPAGSTVIDLGGSVDAPEPEELEEKSLEELWMEE